MSDLSQLMNVAPGSAAFMMGGNNRQAQDTEVLNQQKLQQLIQELQVKNQQSQAMNPLLVEQQGLTNRGLEAGLPGIAANSSIAGTNAAKAAGTLSSDITAGNSKNQTEVVANNAKQQEVIGQAFGRLGASLKNVPDAPGARMLHLQQALANMGLSQDDPRAGDLLKSFSNIPSDKLPDALTAFGNDQLKQSREYLQTKMTADAHIAGIDRQTAAQERIEQAKIAAGKYNKASRIQTADQAIDNAKSARERYQKLVDAATQSKLDGDSESFDRYSARAEAVRPQAEAEIASQKPGGIDTGAVTGMPTNAGPSIAPRDGTNPVPPKIQSITDLQKMYPGIPPDKLREAYKKKFGVDIR